MTGANRCHQIDINARLPAGYGIPASETRRVADQYVDAAKRLARGRDVRVYRLVLRQIALRGVHRVPKPLVSSFHRAISSDSARPWPPPPASR